MNRTSTTSPHLRLDTPKIATLVVLGSETFFFGTLITAYLFMRGTQPIWPLSGASFGRILIPLANTILLLASAASVTWGLRAIRRNQKAALARWTALSLGMGLVFVAGQVYEYTSNGMQPGDSGFGGVFFTLMGFHALHLIAGIIALALVFVRTRLGDFTARKHTAVEVSAWFWYYVVGVWLVLFAVLYLI